MNRKHIFSLVFVSFALAAPGCDEAVEAEDLEIAAEPADAEEAEEAELFSEEPGDLTTPVDPAASAQCLGWDNGGRWCLAECWNSTKRHVIGHVSVVPYGTCESAGKNFCKSRGGLWHACWGTP